VKRDDLHLGFLLGSLFGVVVGAVLMWWLLSPGFAAVTV
jgi:hypothetical protein